MNFNGFPLLKRSLITMCVKNPLTIKNISTATGDFRNDNQKSIKIFKKQSQNVLNT